KENYIGCSDLDGKRRTVIVNQASSQHLKHIFALSLFEQRLYWTDWHTKAIATCDKRKCKNSTNLLKLHTRPMDLRVYHPLRQPKLPQDPCKKLNCQALCLLRP